MKFIVLFYSKDYIRAAEIALDLLKQWGHTPGEFNKFIEPVLFIISGYKYFDRLYDLDTNTAKLMRDRLIFSGVNAHKIIADEQSDNYTNFIKNVYVIITKFVKLSLDDKYNKYYNSDEYFKKYFTVEFDDFLKDMDNNIELNIIDNEVNSDKFKQYEQKFYIDNGPMISLKFHKIS